MLFFTEQNSKIVVTSQHIDSTSVDRWDFKKIEDAQAMAIRATEDSIDDTVYEAVDRGPGCSPRFDVIEMPKIGQRVSRYFNGDCYLDGEIVRMTDGYKTVITSNGSRYRRIKGRGAWVEGQHWVMVSGHRYEQNPHF